MYWVIAANPTHSNWFYTLNSALSYGDHLSLCGIGYIITNSSGVPLA